MPPCIHLHQWSAPTNQQLCLIMPEVLQWLQRCRASCTLAIKFSNLDPQRLRNNISLACICQQTQWHVLLATSQVTAYISQAYCSTQPMQTMSCVGTHYWHALITEDIPHCFICMAVPESRCMHVHHIGQCQPETGCFGSQCCDGLYCVRRMYCTASGRGSGLRTSVIICRTQHSRPLSSSSAWQPSFFQCGQANKAYNIPRSRSLAQPTRVQKLQINSNPLTATGTTGHAMGCDRCSLLFEVTSWQWTILRWSVHKAVGCCTFDASAPWWCSGLLQSQRRPSRVDSNHSNRLFCTWSCHTGNMDQAKAAVHNVMQNGKEAVMGAGQAAKESITGRPMVSGTAGAREHQWHLWCGTSLQD